MSNLTTCPHAPTIDAGPDQAEIGLTTGLSGVVATDCSYVQLGYMWEYVSGPGTVIFGTANNVSTTVTVSTPGFYEFKLTANDGYWYVTDYTSCYFS